MAHLERVVVLVDMDCFYCQVEEKLNADLKDKPIAVVQYNAWRGGGIIAVNYPARDKGVTRHMRGDEAQKVCPEIILCSVPSVRGKADLTKYREAGKKVAVVLHKFTELLQRASIDEAYLDITVAVEKYLTENDKKVKLGDIPGTYVYGSNTEDFLKEIFENNVDYNPNLKLIVGAVIVEQIRAAVYNETGYRCSAGIAHNKILAKLACGFNKPNKQTVLPHANVSTLYKELPVRKIKSLGGKFGETLSAELNIKFMSELEKFTEKTLQQKYDKKTGSWLFNIARGIDLEPVEVRLCPKSIGCCKRFPGKNSLNTPQDVEHWFRELAGEVIERLTQELEENNRKSKHLTVNYSILKDKRNISCSKARGIPAYDQEKLTLDALEVVQKANKLERGSFKYPVTFLGLTAGKFEQTTTNIKDFFAKNQNKKINQSSDLNTEIEDESSLESVEAASKFEPSTDVFATNQSNKVIESFEVNLETQIENIEEDVINLENITINPREDESESTVNDLLEPENITSNSSNLLPPMDDKTQNESLINHNTKSFLLNFLTDKIKEPYKDCIDDSENESPDYSHLLEQNEPEETNFCKDCKRNIPKSELLSHSDYHFALKMAADTPNQVQIGASLNPKKSQKVSPVNKKISTGSNINKFFTKKLVEVEGEESQVCDKCQRRIPIDDFMEHQDYHFAREIQKSMNSDNLALVKTVIKLDDQKSGTKTKRKTNSNLPVSKKPRSVISFFGTTSER